MALTNPLAELDRDVPVRPLASAMDALLLTAELLLELALGTDDFGKRFVRHFYLQKNGKSTLYYTTNGPYRTDKNVPHPPKLAYQCFQPFFSRSISIAQFTCIAAWFLSSIVSVILNLFIQ